MQQASEIYLHACLTNSLFLLLFVTSSCFQIQFYSNDNNNNKRLNKYIGFCDGVLLLISNLGAYVSRKWFSTSLHFTFLFVEFFVIVVVVVACMLAFYSLARQITALTTTSMSTSITIKRMVKKRRQKANLRATSSEKAYLSLSTRLVISSTTSFRLIRYYTIKIKIRIL